MPTSLACKLSSSPAKELNTGPTMPPPSSLAAPWQIQRVGCCASRQSERLSVVQASTLHGPCVQSRILVHAHDTGPSYHSAESNVL